MINLYIKDRAARARSDQKPQNPSRRKQCHAGPGAYAYAETRRGPGISNPSRRNISLIPRRPGGARFVLDQREAHVTVAILAKADAGEPPPWQSARSFLANSSDPISL